MSSRKITADYVRRLQLESLANHARGDTTLAARATITEDKKND